MKHEYTHFIPENVAPKGATRIVVKKKISESEEAVVCTIPATRFGGLTHPTGKPLYSFGLVSDCHTFLSATNWNGNTKLKNALAYFIKVKCDFVVGCGDFTQTGFYRDTTAESYDEGQMLAYNEILESRNIPVYEIYGNHENYNNASIVTNLTRAKELTGIPHTAYTISNSADSDTATGTTDRPNRQELKVENDLFIMVGQSKGSEPMSDSDLDWLEHILNTNTNKRCFIFIHSFIDDNWEDKTTEQRDVERPAEDEDGYILSDSGNPCGARGNAIVGWWEDSARAKLVRFLNILKSHPNAVIFHGHSHMKFESQEFDKCANYTDKNGFKSVHVPSLGSPRRLLNTDGDWDTYAPGGYNQPDSQCYLVDAYDDFLVLNGLSFSGESATPVPLGTYKIVVKSLTLTN